MNIDYDEIINFDEINRIMLENDRKEIILIYPNEKLSKVDYPDQKILFIYQILTQPKGFDYNRASKIYKEFSGIVDNNFPNYFVLMEWYSTEIPAYPGYITIRLNKKHVLGPKKHRFEKQSRQFDIFQLYNIFNKIREDLISKNHSEIQLENL